MVGGLSSLMSNESTLLGRHTPLPDVRSHFSAEKKEDKKPGDDQLRGAQRVQEGVNIVARPSPREESCDEMK